MGVRNVLAGFFERHEFFFNYLVLFLAGITVTEIILFIKSVLVVDTRLEVRYRREEFLVVLVVWTTD